MAGEEVNFGAGQPPEVNGAGEFAAAGAVAAPRRSRSFSLMAAGVALAGGAVAYAHFEGTAEAGTPGQGNGNYSADWGGGGGQPSHHPSKHPSKHPSNHPSHHPSSSGDKTPCPPSSSAPSTGKTSPSAPPSTGETSPSSPPTTASTTPGGGKTTSSEHTTAPPATTTTTSVITTASHNTPTPSLSTIYAPPETGQGAKPASYTGAAELGGVAGGVLLAGLGLMDFKAGGRRIRTYLPQGKHRF